MVMRPAIITKTDTHWCTQAAVVSCDGDITSDHAYYVKQNITTSPYPLHATHATGWCKSAIAGGIVSTKHTTRQWMIDLHDAWAWWVPSMQCFQQARQTSCSGGHHACMIPAGLYAAFTSSITRRLGSEHRLYERATHGWGAVSTCVALCMLTMLTHVLT